jgi:hypothetical protein
MKPVEECFYFFPQFKKDFNFLIKNKKIVIKTENRLLWDASDVSLGQYFYDFKNICKRPVAGGFWRPIETAFNIPRGTLRHLVSSNGRGPAKTSIAYKNLMKELVPYREKYKIIETFLEIKNIIRDADRGNYSSMEQSLDKIKKLRTCIFM